MRRLNLVALTALLALLLGSHGFCAAAESDMSSHTEGFVTANGKQLQYLDWGGSGPTLILIHGLGDNPHIFDDLAPAFSDRFHVIAYARRGHGRSDVGGPYDTATLTEDLRGVMDALQIEKAALVGWSMGGNEITQMAIQYPDRVDRIIYLDSYDTGEAEFQLAYEAIPSTLVEVPVGILSSYSAFQSYEWAVEFAGLDDIQRVDAYLRASVVRLPDGNVKYRMSNEVAGEMLASLWSNPPRNYARIHVPVLAIYAESAFDLNTSDAMRRREAVAWERRFMAPLRIHSVARIRRELPTARILTVPGSHSSFFITGRERVADAMQSFLLERTP